MAGVLILYSGALAKPLADHHAANLSANGYTVLRSLLTEAEVDAVAAAVDRFVAVSGVNQQTSRVVQDAKWGGLSCFDFRSVPALGWIFSVVTRKALLQDTMAAAARAAGGTGYRFMSRNEVNVDRSIGWHRDTLGGPIGKLFSLGADGAQRWGTTRKGERRGPLYNLAVYLQDHQLPSAPPALVLSPGSHSRVEGNGHPVSLHPRKGDAVIFNFRVSHRSGNVPVGQSVEALLGGAKHRSMLNIGYGLANNRLVDWYERGFDLRNRIYADNQTYGCSGKLSGPCPEQWARCEFAAHAKGEDVASCARSSSPTATRAPR